MHVLRNKILLCTLVVCLVSTARGGTFGKVVPIGGHASDIALDERRGVIYVANFTANRIDVVSTADHTLQNPIRVAAQPGSLALSPDGRYLVVGHFATWTEGVTIEPAVTVLDLDAGLRQTLAIGASPLTAAFGAGSLALIVTTEGFQLLNPANGTFQDVAPEALSAEGLPVPFATFPPEIIQASSAVSGDGRYVVGLAQSDEAAVHFRYDVFTQQLIIIRLVAEPELGPRVVSVNQDGSSFLLGWGLFNSAGVVLAQFPVPTGDFNIGSHAVDSSRSLIYAQIPEGTAPTATPTSPTDGSQTDEEPPATTMGPPVLHILDSDNLTVRERLRLPENLAGKSLLSSDKQTMYSVSDSGLMVLPIGSLAQTPRVTGSQEDVVFRGNFCDNSMITQEIDIVDPGGGSTDFILTTTTPGVAVSPSAGFTPTRVRVTVDPTVFQNQKGTSTSMIEIGSRAAVNIPPPVRVLVNTREPEQRGMFFNVPGKLVDIIADPVRDRFYVLRQDKNQLLVFDGTGFNLITTLRTGNTPVQMAITRDLRYLIVGNDNSQIAHVYDLDTLQPSNFIAFPFGHYPRSIAVSNNSILAAARTVTETHSIDRIDFDARTASELPSLGIFENDINVDTVLAATPSGSMIFGAMPDGTVLLYEAVADTFVASRQDFDALSGAYAALTDQLFVVGNKLLNWSLVPVAELETQTGSSSGFAFVDGVGLRTTSLSSSSPGVIERVDLLRAESLRPTRTIESPLLAASLETPRVGQIGQRILPFTRTLAPLANRNSIVSLTTSGFTVFPWDFDVALAEPIIQSVVNVADEMPAVAPGGLISILGSELSQVTVSNTELPVPTTLGEACLTVNGVLAPMFLASPGRINAQLPFEVSGAAKMILRTPGGTSNTFDFTVLQSAPAVFQNGTAGPDTGLATIVRSTNNELVTLSNPIHPEDHIVIFLTGLGLTSPEVATGAPAPSDPLALALLEPEVTLGGVSLDILYAGLVPGQVGVYQINAFVPFWVPRGMQVPLAIRRAEDQITLNVRVVK